jgi:hypothetical protein
MPAREEDGGGGMFQEGLSRFRRMKFKGPICVLEWVLICEWKKFGKGFVFVNVQFQQ